MTQKHLSRHISAIRRIQSRLGTHPKANLGNTNVLQEQANTCLLNTLNPKLKLCDFHPFTEQVQFDYDVFDWKQSPVKSSGLTGQIDLSAAKQPGIATDTGAGTQAYSYYQHISRLVVAMEQVIATTVRAAVSDQAGVNIKSASSSSQTVLTSKPKQFPMLDRQDTKADNTSGVPRTGETARGAFPPTKRNIHPERSAQTNNVASPYITIFQKIIENIQFLEQSNAKTASTIKTPVSASSGGSNTNATNATNATIGSQKTLRSLTQSLWVSQAANLDTTDSAVASEQQRQRKPHTSALLQNDTNQDNYSSSQDQKTIVAARHHQAITTTRPAQPFGSLLSAADTSHASSGTEQNGVHSLKPGFSFQDIGRLEALKVADALSDYLQEQAGLHGVDLS